MDFDDINSYPPNSHKSKTTDSELQPVEKKIEKVITGTVKEKKKSGLRRILGVFMPEDVEDVKSYIFLDIIVPTIKNVLSDSFNAYLYGRNAKPKPRISSESASYRSYYTSNKSSLSYDNSTRNGFEYDDIVLESRGDAEDVLVKMKDTIEIYGSVSIGDLYEMVGLSTVNYNNHNYGWKSLKTAEVLHVRDGYLLKLPKAIALK